MHPTGKREWHLCCSLSREKQRLLYALTKNPTHESAGAGVQGAFGQYPIIPPTVPNENPGNGNIVKNGGLQFSRPIRLRAHTVLLAVDSESPDEYAFESVGGNIKLMGIVDFAEIRPNCTEDHSGVALRDQEQVFRLAGSAAAFRRCLCDGRIARIRAHFEGIAAGTASMRSVLHVGNRDGLGST